MREFESIIKDTINSNKSNDLKVFQEKLIFTKYEISGVKMEVVKKLAKTILKENLNDIITYLENYKYKSFEELTIYGFVLAYVKMEPLKKKEYLKHWLKDVDNWSSCDSVVCAFKEIGKEKADYFEFISDLVKDNNEYTRRFGIVSFLSYYLDDEYIDKVLYIIKNIKDDRYYIKMAISWLIATALAKEWDKTIVILENKVLDTWIHNKSIRKAIESFRVSKEHKDILRGLAIK